MWKRGQRPPYRYAPLLDRVNNKVRIDGDPLTACWLWLGALSKKNGRARNRGSARPVIQLAGRGSPIMHPLRVLLSMLDGVPLKKRSQEKALHTCDNERCINPHHGYWGTDADNIRDRRVRNPKSFLRKAWR